MYGMTRVFLLNFTVTRRVDHPPVGWERDGITGTVCLCCGQHRDVRATWSPPRPSGSGRCPGRGDRSMINVQTVHADNHAPERRGDPGIKSLVSLAEEICRPTSSFACTHTSRGPGCQRPRTAGCVCARARHAMLSAATETNCPCSHTILQSLPPLRLRRPPSNHYFILRPSRNAPA